MDIAAILHQFDAIADARGWRPLQTPRNLAAALSVEAAELLSLFQWGGDVPLDAEQRAQAASEAADVLMYLVAFCDRTGIDLGQAVLMKQQCNSRRFLDERR